MDYKIPFRGLNEGEHHYEFSFEKEFFESFSDSDISDGRVNTQVKLIKRSTGLECSFEIAGKVKVPCDRCLDQYLQDIEHSGKLFFEYGDETKEISDELMVLSGTEDFIDMGEIIFEYINLSLPFQKIHPDDHEGNSLCNQEMIDKLNELKGNNNSDEIDDPRWDKLRDLIN